MPPWRKVKNKMDIETKTEHKGYAIGIDLGTTNSLAAAVMDGSPRTLEGSYGAIVPSVIFLKDGKS